MSIGRFLHSYTFVCIRTSFKFPLRRIRKSFAHQGCLVIPKNFFNNDMHIVNIFIHSLIQQCTLGPAHMILLAEMSRLVGWISSCVHMEFFTPLAEKARDDISACETCTFKSLNYLAILAFLFIFIVKKKHCFSNIFDTFIKYQQKAK